MIRLLLPLALCSMGCVSTLSDSVQLNPTIQQDDEYEEALDRYTRDAKVITDFENRYEVTVTFLSSDFRGALAKRYGTLFRNPEPMLEEATDKTGFIVVLYAPEDEGYDLADADTWSLLIDLGSEQLKPVAVKRLYEKERLKPFFSRIHNWSREYLVLFDAPAGTSSKDQMVNNPALELTIANADAQVRLKW